MRQEVVNEITHAFHIFFKLNKPKFMVLAEVWKIQTFRAQGLDYSDLSAGEYKKNKYKNWLQLHTIFSGETTCDFENP